MKAIEKELDRLVQRLSENHRCHHCGKPAECVHHIITRRDKMLRYDIVNLTVLCLDCHRAIHDGHLKEESFLPKEVFEYLEQVKNQSYKDFLIFEMQMTEDEYLKSCREKLESLIQR